jgi:MoaA/NifB/PqqE/SkfB family radical SAM enzyme
MFALINLELTNLCNFRCEFCPTDKQTRAFGHMDKRLAMRLIQEIRDHDLSQWACFNIMGEPYLHKDLPELCQFAEDRGLHIRLNTNGTFLDPEMNRKIFATNLSRLEISFRTPNSTTFMKRQRSTRFTFEQYVEKIKGLLEDSITLKPRTSIEIKFFVDGSALFFPFTRNYRQLTNREDNIAVMKSLHQHCLAVGERVGMDMKPFRNLNIQPTYERIEIAPRIYVTSGRIQDFWMRENADQSHSGFKARFGGCPTFRRDFGILYNGDVTTCTWDYDGRNVVGNVQNRPLVEILASSEVKRIRKSFDRYVPPLDFCRKCLGGPNLPSSMANQILTSVRDFVARRRKTGPASGSYKGAGLRWDGTWKEWGA